VKKSERITAIILSVGGLLIMVYSWRTLQLGPIHTPGAGFLPFLAGAGLAILATLWLVTLQSSREKEAPSEKRLWHRPLFSVLLMIAYGWAMETSGYISSTLIFMVAWQRIIEREKWVKTIIIAVLSTAGMYALFVYLLRVPVPEDFLVR
jgi:drug/metabolite transporter (DMT)-like permease